jgi:hypothetical protein
MSQQEKNNYINSLCEAIESYQGFTSSEKKFGLENIHNWIDNEGNLDTFISKFSELSLDVKPFIEENHLTYA